METLVKINSLFDEFLITTKLKQRNQLEEIYPLDDNNKYLKLESEID